MHLFVDNLTNVDFSYLHPQRGLLGETWLASTQLHGTLDQQGMVCDFGVVKKTIRSWLDTSLDHCLAVPTHSPHLQIREMGETIALDWQAESGLIQCRAPSQAIALVNAETVTPNSVSRWCIEQLKPLLPETLSQLQLDFSTEAIDGDFYQYSHGLKKHTGNCQRIAHGHRSRIQIWRDNERAHDWEAIWASHLCDSYVGTRSDIQAEDDTHYHFAYTTSQGEFALSIPRGSCYIIETDSTVEFIAAHIAASLHRQYPSHHITVKAFEGIGKGAISET